MNFSVAINRILSAEGGYVYNPEDPGGETKFGISKRSYPNADIANLTRDQAIDIYRADFWDKVHANDLPDAVAFQALDFAVNSGVDVAIRKLQAAVGVADDGHWGPVTQTAIAAANQTVLALNLVAARLDYMRSCSGWASFGKGWAGRIATDLRDLAMDL